jgi:hypothetical protein
VAAEGLGLQEYDVGFREAESPQWASALTLRYTE